MRKKLQTVLTMMVVLIRKLRRHVNSYPIFEVALYCVSIRMKIMAKLMIKNDLRQRKMTKKTDYTNQDGSNKVRVDGNLLFLLKKLLYLQCGFSE